jgi:hypothetical protein
LDRFLQECRAARLAPAASDRAVHADFPW